MNFDIASTIVTAALLLYIVGHFLWTIAKPDLSFSRIYHIAGIMLFSGYLIDDLDKIEVIAIEHATMFGAILGAVGASIILVFQYWTGKIFASDRKAVPVFWGAMQFVLTLYILLHLFLITLQIGSLFPETAL